VLDRAFPGESASVEEVEAVAGAGAAAGVEASVVSRVSDDRRFGTFTSPPPSPLQPASPLPPPSQPATPHALHQIDPSELLA